MKLKTTYKQTTTKDGLYAYALHVSVESDDDPNVFVMQRSTMTMNPFGQTDLWFNDEFVNIATPVDMYDIPVGQPDPCHGMPYYRTSEIDLWFRNLEDLEQAKKDIDEDLASLSKLYNKMENEESYEHEETREYGK